MRHLRGIIHLITKIYAIFAFSFSAHASQIIDYTTFTQLSRDKQIKVVKMLHEYVTFMEHTQLKAELQKNPRYTQYNQYSQLLSLFIQSAHADDDTEDVFIDKDEQACVYAGWISYIYNGRCRHPRNINPSQVEGKLEDYLENKTYPTGGPFVLVTTTKKDGKTDLKYEENKTSCNRPNQIICSPTLFGTSTGEANGAPFCVEGSGSGYNSSFLCSQAVAKHSNREKILNGVIENAIDDDNNRKEFNYLLMSMYDTCMCKGTTQFMNQEYAQRMFPSRTCFAWMYQSQRLMKEIVGPNCRSKFEEDNYGNLATIADWMESAADTLDKQLNPITKDDGNPLQYFDITTQKDDTFKDSREDAFKKYEAQNLCPLQLDPKVEISLTTTDDPLWVELTAELVGVSRTDLTGWSFAVKAGKGEIKDDDNANNNVYLAKKSFGPYTVTATIQDITGEVAIPTLEAPVITISETSRNNDTATLQAEVTAPADTKYTIEWSDGVTPGEDSKSATAPIKDKAYKVKATLKIADQEDTPSNELKIAPTPVKPTINISEAERDEENAKSILKADVTVPRNTEYTITWNNGAQKRDNDQTFASAEIKSEDYTVTATLKVNDKEFKSDPLTIKKIVNDYSIQIKLVSQTDEEGKFKAVVKNKGKVVDDAEIKWFKSKKKAAEKTKETRSTGLNTGIASEEDDDDDDDDDSDDSDGLNTGTGNEDDDKDPEEKEESSRRRKGVLKAGSGKENSIKKEKFDQTIYATVNGVESNQLKLDKKEEEEEEEEKSEQKKVNNSNPVQQQMKRPMPRQRQMRFNMGVR